MIAKSIFNIEDEAISNDKDCFDTYGKGIDFAKADKLNNLGKMLQRNLIFQIYYRHGSQFKLVEFSAELLDQS